MKRREFIAGFGCAVAMPLASHAQEKVRRIGVLMNVVEGELVERTRTSAFMQRLQQLGWVDGRNVRVDLRWSEGNLDRTRKFASELVALEPDVILAVGALSVGALQQASSTVPIVFASVTDPVGAGFVASMARPGGNATGFTQSEYGFSGKWLELLKQLAPRLTRAAVLRDSTLIASTSQFAAIQSQAPTTGIEVHPIDTRRVDDMDRAIAAFAREPNSGLIVVTGSSAIVNRDAIVAFAARYRLPAVYPQRFFTLSGGLISYGPDNIDQFRRAADYVNRILMGEKPADLPVQAPVKYELLINLKTAKALGMTIPPTLLARADEVIE